MTYPPSLYDEHFCNACSKKLTRQQINACRLLHCIARGELKREDAYYRREWERAMREAKGDE